MSELHVKSDYYLGTLPNTITEEAILLQPIYVLKISHYQLTFTLIDFSVYLSVKQAVVSALPYLSYKKEPVTYSLSRYLNPKQQCVA